MQLSLFQIFKCQSVVVCIFTVRASILCFEYAIIYCNACGCSRFRGVGCAAARLFDGIGQISIACCLNNNLNILLCINTVCRQIQCIIHTAVSRIDYCSSELVLIKTEVSFFAVYSSIYLYRCNCSDIRINLFFSQIFKCQSVVVCIFTVGASIFFCEYTIIYCNACGCFRFRGVGCAAAATCLCDFECYIFIACCCDDNRNIIACINADCRQIQFIVFGITISRIACYHSKFIFLQIPNRRILFCILFAANHYLFYAVQVSLEFITGSTFEGDSVIAVSFIQLIAVNFRGCYGFCILCDYFEPYCQGFLVVVCCQRNGIVACFYLLCGQSQLQHVAIRCVLINFVISSLRAFCALIEYVLYNLTLLHQGNACEVFQEITLRAIYGECCCFTLLEGFLIYGKGQVCFFHLVIIDCDCFLLVACCNDGDCIFANLEHACLDCDCACLFINLIRILSQHAPIPVQIQTFDFANISFIFCCQHNRSSFCCIAYHEIRCCQLAIITVILCFAQQTTLQNCFYCVGSIGILCIFAGIFQIILIGKPCLCVIHSSDIAAVSIIICCAFIEHGITTGDIIFPIIYNLLYICCCPFHFMQKQGICQQICIEYQIRRHCITAAAILGGAAAGIYPSSCP